MKADIWSLGISALEMVKGERRTRTSTRCECFSSFPRRIHPPSAETTGPLTSGISWRSAYRWTAELVSRSHEPALASLARDAPCARSPRIAPMPKAGADRSSHEHRRAYDCHSRGSHAYPDTDSLQPHSSPSYPLPLIACSPASLRPTPTHLFCAGPTAKELLSHRWIRAAPSNKCLTSLVDRYERFRSEHPRPPSAYNPSRAKAAYSAPAVLNNDGSWDFGPEDGSSGSTDRGWDFGELHRSGGEQYGSRDGHGAGGSRPAYAPMMRQAGPTYVAPPPIPAQASRDAGGSMKSASAASASSPAHHGGERPASGGHLSSSRAGSVGGGSSAGGAGAAAAQLAFPS